MKDDADDGILRHSPPSQPFTPPPGTDHLADIEAHVAQHFGAVRGVFHELVSDLVHVDLLFVEIGPEHPWITVVTSGMSDLPMAVPAGSTAPPRIELVLRLMANHPLDQAAWQDERHYWPFRHLKQLARMPHQLATWFAAGQTVATDPPTPVAPGEDFCGFGFVELLNPAARELRAADGTTIAFLQVVPLYREELEWKLAQGPKANALADLFDSEALRLAYHGRPPLRGKAWDARVAGLVELQRRGRRLVLGMAIGLGLLSLAEVAAGWADDAKVRWARLCFGLSLAWWLAEGRVWARWLWVVLGGLGAVASGVVVATIGVSNWRTVHLAAASPVLAGVALGLVFAPSVRAWYLGLRLRSR